MSQHGDVESMALDRLQRWMQAVIIHPGTTAEALGSPDALRDGLPGGLASVILPSKALSAAEHLCIYRDMYRLRLERALADDHPATLQVLGPDRFSALARDYITRHPSRSFTLNGYGAGFAAFLATSSDLDAGQRAWLADLVRLEAAIAHVHETPTDEPVSPARLAEFPADAWEHARLVPVSGLRLITLSFAVGDVYQAWLDGTPVESPRRRISRIVVYRHGDAVRRLELTRDARELLVGLAAGRALGDALADVDVRSQDDLDPGRVFRWLRQWVGEGLFADIAAG